ncbi:MAG: AMP-binding protein, partial [Gammaproteobacteria bacterium]
TVAIGWVDMVAPDVWDRERVAFNYADICSQSREPRRYENQACDPAHILFTSGSTGVPKGVVITHANVKAFITWAVRYFGLNRSDRLSGHPPLHFDLSVFDIFGSFAAGAQLHLVPATRNLLPNRLAEWIRTSEITHWFSVPSALTYMAKFGVVRHDDFPELKRVLWCGEVFPTPSLIHWMKRVPHAAFTNLYGPTEATIASSYYTLERCPQDDKATIPIGKACDGEELLVLNQALEPVSAGETGDLYISGSGLSSGYWRNQAETDKAFLILPGEGNKYSRLYRTGDIARVDNHGLVYFSGRKDYQVKSRGYRIELGEIETVLNTLESLRECVVIAVPSEEFDGMKICCAYVPHEGSVVTPVNLRAQLSAELPDYMIPSQWRSMSELPKNPAGKIDSRKIAETWQWNATGTA